MDSSFLLIILAAAIGFLIILRKFKFHQENKAIESSSLSPSSSVPPSSSSSSHNWTHQVFPSFRGEDVRTNFLSYIHKEFQRKGISTFIDNEIKRGESIGPELIQAIRGSKIAIILLSRNYASSKWCLDELVEIMKCREELGQTVMAVFYKVDPSDVKKLTGDFGKIFRKTCKGKSKEDIGRWKEALMKVATIAGYHSINWDNEAAMVEKIATDVSNELMNSAPSSDFDSLVGMGARMRKIEPFLHLGSDEVRMIGIWGPSGIGKSTIARVLFTKYSHNFNLSAFMENTKRRYPRPCYDEYSAKLQLQKELLTQIISQDDIKIQNLGVAQHMLKDKKVLVVLDDVDQSLQLDAMAKETGWFGPGSRIIITTQDKKLLSAHGITHIYEMDFPHDAEALQIFCTYAFGQKSPYEGFENLALEVTQLAGKLPLGLRVMGSYFKGMPKHEWKMALPRLRTSLDGEIESILKFSYDALCDEDKDLFLYIACIFNDEIVEKVEEHLEDNFVNVRQGLDVLFEKSLIYMSKGYLKMHDLLARLGRKIVRKQSIHDPGQRQFLVDARETCQVLSNDTIGSRRVIGINFKYSEIKDELNTTDRAFERMTNLQFLRLHGNEFYPRSYLNLQFLRLQSNLNLQFLLRLHDNEIYPRSNLPQSMIYLTPAVRLLHWKYFPLTCLPCNYNPEFLVELNMPYSKLEKLWEGTRRIGNLKWMDLSFSIYLKELPDLSTAINLQELNLSGCSNLVKLPSSIGSAISLSKLDLDGCSSLVEIPSSIGNAINLSRLNLSYSFYLRELPSTLGNATSLEVLSINRCTGLVELPSSIGNATNLRELSLEACINLLELPSSIGKAINLETLSLSGSSRLVQLPSSLGNAIKILTLDLKNCTSLVKLPSSIGNITNLENLDLSGCSNLVELPSSIGNLHNLLKLNMKGCSKLENLPININMKSLDEVDLRDCLLLTSFPEISTNIGLLRINGTAIEGVPSSIRSWSRIDDLHMSYHENLDKFPHSFDFITVLHLSDSRIIQGIAPWIRKLSRLRALVIKGCKKLVSLPELPDSLKILDAKDCESLERLDSPFHNTKFLLLNFTNCFKLSQETRDLIIKTWNCDCLVPGEKVPTFFFWRASGSSLAMKWNGPDTHLPTSLRFKACVLLINKGDVEVDDGLKRMEVSYCIKEKQNDIKVTRISKIHYYQSPLLSEHLYTFDLVEEVPKQSDMVVFDKVGNNLPAEAVHVLKYDISQLREELKMKQQKSHQSSNTIEEVCERILTRLLIRF